MKMSSKRNLISSQYLKPDKIPVSIIEIKDPATLVVKECPNLLISEEAEKFLEAEEMMQKFYDSIEPSFVQLPLKDAIVIVLVDKKYFRAQIRSILNMTDGYIFKVYLLDYGKECTVPRSSLYEITHDFLVHPFQAATFKLLDILPISLVMSSEDMTLSYGSVQSWDPSAVSHLQKLQKALDQAYIVVKGVEKDCLYGSLYMHLFNGGVVCVNEDLVEKKFAANNPSAIERLYNKSSSVSSAPKKFVGSSSESVKSFCSTDSGKTEKSNYSSKTLQRLSEIKKYSPNKQDEKEKICNANSQKQSTQRKMTGSIAVDVEKLNRQNKECNDKDEPKEVLTPFSRFQKIIKNQTNSVAPNNCCPKSEDSCIINDFNKENAASSLKPESLNTSEKIDNLCDKQLSSLSLSESLENNNLISQNTKIELESVCSKDKKRYSPQLLTTEQNTLEKKTNDAVKTQIPLVQEPPKVLRESSSKLDLIKRVLNKKSTSPSSKLPSASETVTLNNGKNDHEKFSQKETNQKSSDALKELVESVMSDVDDQDDLLQITLKPTRDTNSSSGTETSRYVNQ